jgi:PAT family beta-lactamase induction signal transducer AmpG
VAVSVDNVAAGFAGTCLIAYMSSLTTAGFTATQYALFSSLYALPGKLVASFSGRVVEDLSRAAEQDGFLTQFKSLFGSLPPGALDAGAAKVGVSPQALGVGYSAFFIYTFILGLVVIPLAIAVAARVRR